MAGSQSNSRDTATEFVSDCPPLARPYDSGELEVDRAIHLAGLGLGVVAAVVAVVFAFRADTTAEATAIVVYAFGLVAMLTCSMAYHLTPVSRLKDIFRRLDHAAIFLMIAGTCSGFTLGRAGAEGSLWLTGLAWSLAIAGVVLKLLVPRKFEHVALVAYVAVGFISLAAVYPLLDDLDAWSLGLLLLGAALYLSGVAVHVWSTMRFQNAIWHGFVVLGASAHYAAIVMERV